MAIENIAIILYNVATNIMTRRYRLFKKFFRNPDSLNYYKIEKLLLILDFEKIETKGSHKKFKHKLLRQDLIIPVHNNDCKSFYKHLVKKIIKSYFR